MATGGVAMNLQLASCRAAQWKSATCCVEELFDSQGSLTTPSALLAYPAEDHCLMSLTKIAISVSPNAPLPLTLQVTLGPV
jgi:hypothetical protein